MSKVVTLFGTELPSSEEPSQEIIEAIEEMLQLARDGQILGFSAMIQRKGTNWRAYEVGPFEIEPMIGHLTRQIHLLARESDAQNGDD